MGGYKLEFGRVKDEEPVFKLAPISFKDKKLANYDMSGLRNNDMMTKPGDVVTAPDEPACPLQK